MVSSLFPLALASFFCQLLFESYFELKTYLNLYLPLLIQDFPSQITAPVQFFYKKTD